MEHNPFFSKLCLLVAATSVPIFGGVIAISGNSYTSSGTAATSNVRATWAGTDPALTWDNVVLTGDTPGGAPSECTGSCIPSYTSNGSLNSVSGSAISGVTFVGGNGLLYVRPTPIPSPSSGLRNSGYFGLNAQGAYPWRGGLATSEGIAAPSITITLPTGTRSVGFDYGSITNLAQNDGATLAITANMLGGATSSLPTLSRYDVNRTSPSYAATGPGFYGVTSSTEDILTITIIANASTGNWILNIANFRAGVQINAPTPEPNTFLAMGSALILISFLLRRRGKFARGGTA